MISKSAFCRVLPLSFAQSDERKSYTNQKVQFIDKRREVFIFFAFLALRKTKATDPA